MNCYPPAQYVAPQQVAYDQNYLFMMQNYMMQYQMRRVEYEPCKCLHTKCQAEELERRVSAAIDYMIASTFYQPKCSSYACVYDGKKAEDYPAPEPVNKNRIEILPETEGGVVLDDYPTTAAGILKQQKPMPKKGGRVKTMVE